MVGFKSTFLGSAGPLTGMLLLNIKIYTRTMNKILLTQNNLSYSFYFFFYLLSVNESALALDDIVQSGERPGDGAPRRRESHDVDPKRSIYVNLYSK